MTNRFQYMREGLDGDNNNRGTGFQLRGQLLGFTALRFLTIDPRNHAFVMVKLINRILQLTVEHGAVGNHNH